MQRPLARHLGLFLALALTAAAAGVGGVAWANHNFSDVNDGSFFGPGVNAGADAGCFRGYNDGEFKGNRNPTRNEFAYWLDNCGGRVAQGFGNGDLYDNSAATIASLDIDVAGTGTQFVLLTASVDVTSDPIADTCSSPGAGCRVVFTIEKDGTQLGQLFAHDATVDGSAEVVTFSVVAPAPAGTQTYDLVADGFGLSGGPGRISSGSAQLTAITAPFGDAGPLGGG